MYFFSYNVDSLATSGKILWFLAKLKVLHRDFKIYGFKKYR